MLSRFGNILNSQSKDYLFLLLAQGLNYLTPLLVMPYLMKVLGASSYGLVGFSLAVIGYSLLFIDFGFNLSATKRIAMQEKKDPIINDIFSATLLSKLAILGVICIILIGLYLFNIFGNYSNGVLYSIPTLFGSALTFFWLYQGLGLVRKITLFVVIARILLLPLIFLFVKSPNDYLIALILLSGVYVLTAILSIWYICKKRLVKFKVVGFKSIYNEIKESYPLFLSAASIAIYTQLFILILGFYSTQEVVGQYSAAERIMRALVFLFYTPMSQLFYPRIASVGSSNWSAGYKLFSKVKKTSLLLMLFATLLLVIGSDVIEAYLGFDYKGISMLLKIFSIAPFFIVYGGIMGQMGILALGESRDKLSYTKTYYYAAIFSLLIVLCLVQYNAVGITITVVLTEIFVACKMSYVFNKIKKRYVIH